MKRARRILSATLGCGVCLCLSLGPAQADHLAKPDAGLAPGVIVVASEPAIPTFRLSPRDDEAVTAPTDDDASAPPVALDPEALAGLSPERQRAVAALWADLDRTPDDAALWTRLGDALAARPTQADAAIAAYSTALLYDPSLTDTERTLAGLLTSRGYFGAALTTYESLLSRTAEDPDWLDLAMACTLYARTETLDRGAALLEHMLLISPHDRTLLALGTLERARGNEDGGTALIAMIRDNPRTEPLLRALAETLLREEGQP
jgi:tetratricopeptide (TPR) repeat protein